MPIRFRCVYCDKLLGIARRKAGAVVNCPQCGQPLIVPTPEPEPERATAATAAPSAPAKSPGGLFERDDFDVVLQSDATVRASENEAPPRPRPPRSSPPPPVPPPLQPQRFAVEKNLPSPRDYAPAPLPLPAPRREKGMVLTTGKLIMAMVVVFILVLAAFGGGLLVGRMLSSAASG